MLGSEQPASGQGLTRPREAQGADRCSGQGYTITWFPLAPKE